MNVTAKELLDLICWADCEGEEIPWAIAESMARWLDECDNLEGEIADFCGDDEELLACVAAFREEYFL